MMKNKVIPITLKEKHLGNVIGKDCADLRISKATNELYISCNKLSGEFSCIDIDTRYFLFKTHCHTFYGCQLLDFSRDSINDIFCGMEKMYTETPRFAIPCSLCIDSQNN